MSSVGARIQRVSPSVTWIDDFHGNAPITIGTFLQGTRSAIAALDFAIDKRMSARVSYRAFVNKGNDADRFSDRDFVAFSLTRTFP